MVDHVVQFLQRLNLISDIEEYVYSPDFSPVFNQICNTKLIGPGLLAFCKTQTETLIIAADQLAAMIEFTDRPALVRLIEPVKTSTADWL